MVPIAVAASQMARALSRANFSPSPGNAWPTADSLTDTSAAAASPAWSKPFSNRRWASRV